MSELYTYMVERQLIYHRRYEQHRPWPWTLDPVLRDWHFPNVYRELDRGTVYLREQLLPQLEDGQYLLNLVAYRHFNTIEAARRLLPLTTNLPDNLKDLLVGCSPYTRAYRTSPFMNLGGKNPIENTIIASHEWVKALPLLERRLENFTMGGLYRALCQCPGLGPFTAYVVVCDLTYTALVDYTEDTDVFPHTGSVGCLSWMAQSELSNREAKSLIIAIQYDLEYELTIRGFPFYQEQVPSLRAIEDGLCELHRYRALQAGSTSGRRYYPFTEILV